MSPAGTKAAILINQLEHRKRSERHRPFCRTLTQPVLHLLKFSRACVRFSRQNCTRNTSQRSLQIKNDFFSCKAHCSNFWPSVNREAAIKRLLGPADKKPAAVSSAAPREETDSQPLPPGWRSYTSPEGQRYYVNSSSKETTWRRPSLSVDAPQRTLAQQKSLPYANGSHSRIKASQPSETANVALRKPVMNKQPGPGLCWSELPAAMFCAAKYLHPRSSPAQWSLFLSLCMDRQHPSLCSLQP
ncbi:hypothetical protein PAMP_008697 [Pampus punctatissimus]